MRLVLFVWMLGVGINGAAASFEDPLQAQRFDTVVAQLAQDVPPEQGFPAMYEYMEYYEWIGYSDPAKFDDLGDIEKTFGDAYTAYVQRLQDRLNERLGRCDPTVVEEALDFLDFFQAPGYGPVVIISSNRQRFEDSVFWSGYVQWETNDALRDLIDKPGEGEAQQDVSGLVAILKRQKGKARDDAARGLGRIVEQGGVSIDVAREYASDKHSVVRYWSVAALAMAVSLDARDTTALSALRAALGDHSWPVRIAAAQALQNAGDARSRRDVAEIFEHLKQSSQWPSRSDLREARVR